MFDRWIDSYRWWLCALSGLLLVASFAPFSCATCGWIALVPAWWVITWSERARRQPIRHGYLIGLIYFGGTFWWISNVTAIGTFFLVLYLALYPAVWFLLVARLVARLPGETSATALFQALAAAAVWVMLEWWRSWFLTGFNWNELGVSQSPSVIFRQLAAFGGVHLISFVLVAVNILWAEGVLGIVKTLCEKAGGPRVVAVCGGAFHRGGLFRARLASSAAPSRRDAPARAHFRLHPAQYPTNSLRRAQALYRFRDDERTAALEKAGEAFFRCRDRKRQSPIYSSGPRR